MRLVSLPRLVPRDILLSRNALWENCMTTQISLRVKPNWHSFRLLGCHINWWVDGIYNAHGIVSNGSNLLDGKYDLAEYAKPYTMMTYWDLTNDNNSLTPPLVNTSGWDTKLDVEYAFHDP